MHYAVNIFLSLSIAMAALVWQILNAQKAELYTEDNNNNVPTHHTGTDHTGKIVTNTHTVSDEAVLNGSTASTYSDERHVNVAKGYAASHDGNQNMINADSKVINEQ